MTDRPYLIGLTGSIGMGKSTTAAMFAEKGVSVWDADQAVHRLYGKNGVAVGPIGLIWPDAVIAGKVNRDILKQYIANDPVALGKIEQLVHPLVAADRAEFIKNSTADIVLLDIPLLFETGADAQMDMVIVTTAPFGIQRDRVIVRPGMTEAQFNAIVARQMPDAEKRKRADYVIETTSLLAANAQVQTILSQIRKQIDA